MKPFHGVKWVEHGMAVISGIGAVALAVVVFALAAVTAVVGCGVIAAREATRAVKAWL